MTFEEYCQYTRRHGDDQNVLCLDINGIEMEKFCRRLKWDMTHLLGIGEGYTVDMIKTMAWALDDYEGNGKFHETFRYKFKDESLNAEMNYGKEGDRRYVIVKVL